MFRIVTVALLGAIVAVSGCGCGSGFLGANTVRGSGTTVSEPRNLSGFTDVRLSGSGDVLIDQNGADSVTVEAEDNILPLLETTVRDGVLRLGTRPNVSISPTRPIVYHVTVKQLNGFGVSGSGSVRATGVDTDTLRADISGSGSATLAGRADAADLRISGSGSYDAASLRCKTVRVHISGSGDATVNAADRLSANVSGSGSVHYLGRPAVEQHVSGSGSVTPR